MPFKTKEAHNAYFRKYLNARRAAKRAWASEYKAKKGCARCPERDPVCLDFHHRDGAKKEHAVAKIVGGNSLSQKTIEREVKKCIVLCANCHRKEHGYRERRVGRTGNAADC